MRLTRSILIATLLGLTSAAFAAAPAATTTREGRMAEARKDYEATKAGGTLAKTTGAAVAPKAAVKRATTKKPHVAAKARHARHARTTHGHAPAVRAPAVAPR